MLIAILMDISEEDNQSIISQIAKFHEREIYEEEIDLFSTILLCGIRVKKDLIIKEFDLIPVKEFRQKSALNLVENGHNIEQHLSLKKRKKTLPKEQNDLNKKEKVYNKKKAGLKRPMSRKNKILSVLKSQKSFLIYQESFPLPKGIKRIRIKESFETIIEFIEDYVTKENLPVDIIMGEDTAKVVFKEVKKRAA